MSQYISLRILASLGLGRSNKASVRNTPGAPSVTERPRETSTSREEPGSASRIGVSRVRIDG